MPGISPKALSREKRWTAGPSTTLLSWPWGTADRRCVFDRPRTEGPTTIYGGALLVLRRQTAACLGACSPVQPDAVKDQGQTPPSLLYLSRITLSTRVETGFIVRIASALTSRLHVLRTMVANHSAVYARPSTPSLNATSRHRCVRSSQRASPLHFSSLFETNKVAAFEYRRIQGLAADPPQGVKLLLVEPWVRRGILLLSSENTTVLGGEVRRPRLTTCRVGCVGATVLVSGCRAGFCVERSS